MSDPESPITRDGFEVPRQEAGVHIHYDRDEKVPLILRHRDVRAAARDWETYSSDAPLRVPIPSEENVRRIRQIPIELDPPLHTRYRKLIEPWFLRPLKPDYVEGIDRLVAQTLEEASALGEVEVVEQLALPLQSAALAILLGLPRSHADIWVSWGKSLYGDGDGAAKDRAVEDYMLAQFARVGRTGEELDFFAFLKDARLDGRPLSEDEWLGIANLTFAGGRDTVINVITEIIAHFASNPEDALRVRSNPKLAITATEEFTRALSPLAMIGRVCPAGASVAEETVEKGQRVGLCWASANHDETVFDEPHALKLERKPNPHMGFGMGPHACLGSAHARVIMRCLIEQIARLPSPVSIVSAQRGIEQFGPINRALGYDTLRVRFDGKPYQSQT